MKAILNRKQSKHANRWENWTRTKDAVAVATSGQPGGSLRLDHRRLSDRERADLIDLTLTACEKGGLNRQLLDAADRERFETLVEKAAGREAGSVFAAGRESAALARFGADVVRKLTKPPRRPVYQEPGSVQIPQEVFRDIARPDAAYQLVHIGLLVYLALQLENSECLMPGGSLEGIGDDAILTVNLLLGIGANFAEGVEGVQRAIDHLVANRWFTAERTGQTMRLRRGPRYLATIGRRSA